MAATATTGPRCRPRAGRAKSARIFRLTLGFALALGFALGFGRAADAALLAQWVQYVEGGTLEARAVTDAPDCPRLLVDGRRVPMAVRAAPGAGFPVRVCAAPLPDGAARAAIDGATLPLPARAPRRILVVGDTGCRLKGGIIRIVQRCNDPVAWPWPRVAAVAAGMKPDLVIHVGDYYYREAPCPSGFAGCTGSPHGDNWPSWNADFFAPARPLLAAAPWVVVRGNHEDCSRGGPGWTRLIDPEPYQPRRSCVAHDPLYVVPAGGVDLAVVDSSNASGSRADERLVPLYRREFAALAGETRPVWLVSHRPLYGVVAVTASGLMGGNATMAAAVGGMLPAPVDLLLAGHIHVLQVTNFAGGLPPQLIAGNGGDLLNKGSPADLAGLNVLGVRIEDGFSLGGFGFALLERDRGSWHVLIYDAAGRLMRRCALAKKRLDCPAP